MIKKRISTKLPMTTLGNEDKNKPNEKVKKKETTQQKETTVEEIVD